MTEVEEGYGDAAERMFAELEMADYRDKLARMRRLNVRELRALMAHYGHAVKYTSDWPKEAMIEQLIPIMENDGRF